MKRVLVTGATGFIGRWSLPLLAARGYQVHALTSGMAQCASQDVLWHRADLMNPLEVLAIVSSVRPTHLLHFAWYTKHRAFWSSPLNVRWVQASLDLVQAFQRYGGRRMVTAGTCAEYGRSDYPCQEFRTTLAPHTLYGVSKHALQLLTTAFGQQTGLASAWGRIFFLFGPHEQADRLVPSVARALVNGEAARCSQGNQVRDFLDVEDVASAFVALLDSDVTGPVNIGSGVPTRVKDVIDTIGRLHGRADLIQLGAIAAPQDEPPYLVADTTRLATEVQWRPSHTLASGLARTIEWWQQTTVAELTQRS